MIPNLSEYQPARNLTKSQNKGIHHDYRPFSSKGKGGMCQNSGLHR
jgi:hypothetical protein